MEVDVKAVSDVSQELARGITAEPTVDVVVLDPAQLSSYAGSLHAWDKNSPAVKDTHPALLTSATRKGTINAAPKDVSTLALFINTSLWQAAGLSESDYPTTWEQLGQVAAKLTSGGVVGLTLDASYSRVGAFMVQGGGGLTSADGTQATASSEGSVAGLTEVKNLLSSGSAGWGADLSAGSAADAFGQGQAAMVIETESLGEDPGRTPTRASPTRWSSCRPAAVARGPCSSPPSTASSRPPSTRPTPSSSWSTSPPPSGRWPWPPRRARSPPVSRPVRPGRASTPTRRPSWPGRVLPGGSLSGRGVRRHCHLRQRAGRGWPGRPAGILGSAQVNLQAILS